MGLLSGKALLEKQAKYLVSEIAKHEQDIATNQGKVQENKELLERVQNTCLYCAEYIYHYREEDRMAAHITSQHAEEREPELSDTFIQA
jgi:hypothetical protein